MTDPVETIRARLERCTRVGQGWKCRCPAHDDRENSLKLDRGNDDAALVKCHAGCETADVLAAVDLTLADLYPPKAETVHRNGASARVVKTTRYPLRDGAGALVAVHVRQDRADGTKKVHWEQPNGATGLNGLRVADLPLYGLDLLTEGTSEVLLVEGEKAADAARSLGVTALGTVTGAGTIPGDTSLAPLVGLTVYLWPDNDEPGRKHMERIGWRLCELGQPAELIRLVEWKKAPPRGDVADWAAKPGASPEVLRLKLTGAARWEPATPPPSGDADASEPPPDDPHLTDLGNAKRLVARHGADLRYCGTKGAWLVWNGRFWAWDETGEVERRAKETVLSLFAEAADELSGKARKKLTDHAYRSESATRIRAMIALAASEPGVPVAMADLDADPLLVNVRNGTIDLRTGKRREHRRDDLLTRMIDVDHDETATAPTWEAFLAEVVPDQATRDWIQMFFGYALSGGTSEHIVPIAHGRGQNGKSTIVDVIEGVLGPYCVHADIETFLLSRQQSGGSGATPDLARLKGARVVLASESAPGRKLNVARIKDLAGGESIVARELYGKPFEFRPQFSLWLSTNDKPDVPGNDFALWRRLRLIPFTVTIPEERRVLDLDARIVATEAAGVLNWMLEGYAVWKDVGRLPVVEAIRAATEEYRVESDPVGRWISEACEVDPKLMDSASLLYEDFRKWFEAEEPTHKPMTQTAFGKELAKKGFEKETLPGGYKARLGLKLLAKGDDK